MTFAAFEYKQHAAPIRSGIIQQLSQQIGTYSR